MCNILEKLWHYWWVGYNPPPPSPHISPKMNILLCLTLFDYELVIVSSKPSWEMKAVDEIVFNFADMWKNGFCLSFLVLLLIFLESYLFFAHHNHLCSIRKWHWRVAIKNPKVESTNNVKRKWQYYNCY